MSRLNAVERADLRALAAPGVDEGTCASPRRLVARGLIKFSHEAYSITPRGARKWSVYSVTPKGREVANRWRDAEACKDSIIVTMAPWRPR